MCDYSLVNVKSRSAKVGDKLTTRNFGTGTRGFAAPEDVTTAVCVLPGTELAFSQEPTCAASGFLGWGAKTIRLPLFIRICAFEASADCAFVMPRLCRAYRAPTQMRPRWRLPIDASI